MGLPCVNGDKRRADHKNKNQRRRKSEKKEIAAEENKKRRKEGDEKNELKRKVRKAAKKRRQAIQSAKKRCLKVHKMTYKWQNVQMTKWLTQWIYNSYRYILFTFELARMVENVKE